MYLTETHTNWFEGLDTITYTNKTGNVRINVTFRRVRVTMLAVEEQ